MHPVSTHSFPPNNATHEYGFSLIEIMVAFVIASASLGLLYTIQSQASHALAISEEYSIANELARSLLAEDTVLSSMPASPKSGTHADKFLWQVSYSPFAESSGAEQENVLSLIAIELTIEWQSLDQIRRLDLNTVKPLFITGDNNP